MNGAYYSTLFLTRSLLPLWPDEWLGQIEVSYKKANFREVELGPS